MNLPRILLFIVGFSIFCIPSLKSEIMFSETRDLKEAITTHPVFAANTKEDAELFIALLDRNAGLNELDAFEAEHHLSWFSTGTHVMIDRIEETPGLYYYAATVLVHEKGSSQAFWINVFSLLHGCIKVD